MKVRNIVKQKSLQTIIIAGLCLLILGTTANAEEGGSGHYAAGGVATLIDLAPTAPGLIVQPLYLHYNGSAGKSKTIPVANLIAVDLDATIDALTLGGIYTFEQPVLGAHYSVGIYVPYMMMDVTATVTGKTGTVSQTDSVDGIGDVTLIPVMLAWKSDVWQFNALLPIYAPTGDYEVGRLANAGLNYWTVDPTVGVSYANEKTGLNFALHTGITFNTENNDTNYRSGS
ncbi:MAG: transporter, partial [Deltaproteobacteria bacterium]|nr:transporter [Deltaproteobacteria bacterium]